MHHLATAHHADFDCRHPPSVHRQSTSTSASAPPTAFQCRLIFPFFSSFLFLFFSFFFFSFFLSSFPFLFLFFFSFFFFSFFFYIFFYRRRRDGTDGQTNGGGGGVSHPHTPPPPLATALGRLPNNVNDAIKNSWGKIPPPPPPTESLIRPGSIIFLTFGIWIPCPQHKYKN